MKLALWPRGHHRTQDSLSTLFDRFLDSPFAALGNRLPEVFQSGLAPAVNVAESEKSLTVSLELPGLKEEDIDVQILGNQLVVTAERRFEDEKKDKEFHRVEHQYGSFSRSLTLPSGLRSDQVDATYEKGILTLEFPKTEPTPAAKIKVKAKD